MITKDQPKVYFMKWSLYPHKAWRWRVECIYRSLYPNIDNVLRRSPSYYGKRNS